MATPILALYSRPAAARAFELLALALLRPARS
jgi:hypothetical protein